MEMTFNLRKGACRLEHKNSVSSLLKVGRVGLQALRHNGNQVKHKSTSKIPWNIMFLYLLFTEAKPTPAAREITGTLDGSSV